MPVLLGDPEVIGVFPEETKLAGVHGEDARSGGIVEGENLIQLVLTHVADDDRHFLASP